MQITNKQKKNKENIKIKRKKNVKKIIFIT